MTSATPDREITTAGVINIDRTSPVPLYFQLAQHYEAAIRSGALKVGSRLDNEVQLAERLGLSRPTVRAAFLYLSNKGLVVRKRGAGTLVANESIDRDVELTSLYDDLAAAGRAPATKVIRNEVIHATDRVAAALQLPERALVDSLQRIRLADGEPIALMHNFLPAGARAPEHRDAGAARAVRAAPRVGHPDVLGHPAHVRQERLGRRGPHPGREPRRRAADHGAHRLRRHRPPGRVRAAPVPRLPLRVHHQLAPRGIGRRAAQPGRATARPLAGRLVGAPGGQGGGARNGR